MIVEGITASRRAIAADLTMALWVTAPRAERLRRALARDGLLVPAVVDRVDEPGG